MDWHPGLFLRRCATWQNWWGWSHPGLLHPWTQDANLKFSRLKSHEQKSHCHHACISLMSPNQTIYIFFGQVEMETNFHFTMGFVASFAESIPPVTEVEDWSGKCKQDWPRHILHLFLLCQLWCTWSIINAHLCFVRGRMRNRTFAHLTYPCWNSIICWLRMPLLTYTDIADQKQTCRPSLTIVCR